MSDNSPPHHLRSNSSADGQTRPEFRYKKANLIGGCLREAFDHADPQDETLDAIDKLLKLLN